MRETLASETITFKGATWTLSAIDRGLMGGLTIVFSNADQNDDTEETGQSARMSELLAGNSDHDNRSSSRDKDCGRKASTQTLLLSSSDVNEMIGKADTAVETSSNEQRSYDEILAQKKFRAVTLLGLVSLVDIGTPVPLLQLVPPPLPPIMTSSSNPLLSDNNKQSEENIDAQLQEQDEVLSAIAAEEEEKKKQALQTLLADLHSKWKERDDQLRMELQSEQLAEKERNDIAATKDNELSSSPASSSNWLKNKMERKAVEEEARVELERIKERDYAIKASNIYPGGGSVELPSQESFSTSSVYGVPLSKSSKAAAAATAAAIAVLDASVNSLPLSDLNSKQGSSPSTVSFDESTDNKKNSKSPLMSPTSSHFPQQPSISPNINRPNIKVSFTSDKISSSPLSSSSSNSPPISKTSPTKSSSSPNSKTGWGYGTPAGVFTVGQGGYVPPRSMLRLLGLSGVDPPAVPPVVSKSPPQHFQESILSFSTIPSMQSGEPPDVDASISRIATVVSSTPSNATATMGSASDQSLSSDSIYAYTLEAKRMLQPENADALSYSLMSDPVLQMAMGRTGVDPNSLLMRTTESFRRSPTDLPSEMHDRHAHYESLRVIQLSMILADREAAALALASELSAFHAAQIATQKAIADKVAIEADRLLKAQRQAERIKGAYAKEEAYQAMLRQKANDKARELEERAAQKAHEKELMRLETLEKNKLRAERLERAAAEQLQHHILSHRLIQEQQDAARVSLQIKMESMRERLRLKTERKLEKARLQKLNREAREAAAIAAQEEKRRADEVAKAEKLPNVEDYQRGPVLYAITTTVGHQEHHSEDKADEELGQSNPGLGDDENADVEVQIGEALPESKAQWEKRRIAEIALAASGGKVSTTTAPTSTSLGQNARTSLSRPSSRNLPFNYSSVTPSFQGSYPYVSTSSSLAPTTTTTTTSGGVATLSADESPSPPVLPSTAPASVTLQGSIAVSLSRSDKIKRSDEAERERKLSAARASLERTDTAKASLAEQQAKQRREAELRDEVRRQNNLRIQRESAFKKTAIESKLARSQAKQEAIAETEAMLKRQRQEAARIERVKWDAWKKARESGLSVGEADAYIANTFGMTIATTTTTTPFFPSTVGEPAQPRLLPSTSTFNGITKGLESIEMRALQLRASAEAVLETVPPEVRYAFFKHKARTFREAKAVNFAKLDAMPLPLPEPSGLSDAENAFREDERRHLEENSFLAADRASAYREEEYRKKKLSSASEIFDRRLEKAASSALSRVRGGGGGKTAP